MSYISTHRKRDGSVTRKRVTISGAQTPAQAERMMGESLKDMKKRLRDRKGWSSDRSHKLVAHIPNAIVEEVWINDGRDAAMDPDYLVRRARELGYDVEMRR